MTEHFVAAAVYTNEIQAELAQATLAAAGIESYVHFGQLPLLQASEGVRLMVDKDHLEEAKIILTTEASEQHP